MQQELRPDFSLPGEKEIFKDMIKLTINMMEESQDGCPLRVQHAKAAACLTASFEVASNIPADLRHGVFSQPDKVFEAIVRFSTAQGTIEPDTDPTARGLAIKLLDVAGDRAMENDTDRSQDFLFVDHPVFPFPTPKEYKEIIKCKSFPLVGDFFALALSKWVTCRFRCASLSDASGFLANRIVRSGWPEFSDSAYRFFPSLVNPS